MTPFVKRVPALSRKGGEEGFTLLEVLLSVAILGMGVVAAIQLLSGGLRLAKTADEHTGVIFAAREKMAETLLVPRLLEGTTKGADKNIGWTVSVGPHTADKAAPGKRLLAVTVIAEELGGSRSYTVSTLKTVALE